MKASYDRTPEGMAAQMVDEALEELQQDKHDIEAEVTSVIQSAAQRVLRRRLLWRMRRRPTQRQQQ